MKSNNISITILLLILLLSSCKKNLDVENTNQPDKQKTLATGSDLLAVMGGAYEQLFTMYNDYTGSPQLEWTGDYLTMTNNNKSLWSMFKVEPRPVFDNSLNFADQDITLVPWKNLNSAISSCNSIITELEIKGRPIYEIKDGKETTKDISRMVLTSAYFCKAMAQGYIANLFDKGYIVNPETDVTNFYKNPLPLLEHQQMLAASLVNFDKCIALCEKNVFVMDDLFMNKLRYNNESLKRLANTYAAHFMVQNARNSAENKTTDWAKVKQYASEGIVQDFSINLNNDNWRNTTALISGLYWYWRVDFRIIRLLDKSYPKRYPSATDALVPPAKSIDKRLDQYFAYESNMSFFRLDRGAQLRSNYRIRYPQYESLYYSGGTGPMTYMFAYANQLMIAEAEAMLGNTAPAISILNIGSNNRSSIGNLPPLPQNTSLLEVIDAIFYERDIDLMLSDFGIHFKDMRRRNMLQKGTILHFPVPAQELSVVNYPNYTFGGEKNADGINTADGSNSWLEK